MTLPSYSNVLQMIGNTPLMAVTRPRHRTVQDVPQA